MSKVINKGTKLPFKKTKVGTNAILERVLQVADGVRGGAGNHGRAVEKRIGNDTDAVCGRTQARLAEGDKSLAQRVYLVEKLV